MSRNLAIICAAVLFVTLVTAAPSGSYCGSYLGIFSGKVSFTSAADLSVTLDLVSSKTTCPNEPYTFDASSGVITLANLNNPNDCLGKLVADAHLSGITVTYNSGSNTIDLDAGIANLKLSSC